MRAFHFLAATLVALVLIGAATAEDKDTAKSTGLAHVVIFQLRTDAPAGTAEKMIADAHAQLGKIPTVREIRAGKPAAKGSEVAKKDYQVGLVILFDDAQGLKTYTDHPLHKDFVAKYLKFCDLEQLKVYDFEDVKK